MPYLLVPFLFLAAIGFVLSAAAHLMSLFGKLPPGGESVMLLHVGIFIVWIPTVLVANRATKGANRKDFWKIVLAGCPDWMRRAFYGLFAYALLNFVLFLMATSGDRGHTTGITAETVRGFSGHWMVFYGAAFATLYSVVKSPQILTGRKCASGHAVSPTDVYCPTCGKAIARPPRP